ncbi:MAG: GPP34 family phosphoprotein [Blastococcus sp.]
MDLAGGVAVRVAALCLDDHGRLSDRFAADAAVRAGLLVDLALAGRVESTDDSIVVDDTPTGFAPADGLLAAIVVEPERSLDGWLDERRIGLREVADAAVRSGRWELRRRFPRRRFRDLAEAETTSDAGRDASAGTAGWSPEDAAITALALVAGLLRRPAESVAEQYGETPAEPVPESVLARTGGVRWLCEAVTEHVAASRSYDLAAAAALRAGTWSVGGASGQ